MGRSAELSAERSLHGAVALGAASTIVSVLPVYLAGAMVVAVGDELGFGTAGLGVAVAAYWTANAATSVHLGRVVDHLGVNWSLRVAGLAAGTAALGIALASSRWWHLVAWLTLAGCSHSLGQPATNRLLVRSARPERLGAAFGLKSAAPPIASVLAGLSVPTVAVAAGWRWAYALSAAAAAVVALAAGRRPAAAQRVPRPARDARLRRPAVVVGLSATFGLATAASTTVPTFYVDAAVQAGERQEVAGVVLAVASAAALTTRIVSGIACDRIRRGHLWMCAGLLGTGAVGLALLASGRPVAMTVGVVVALTGAWGFNAVFWFALVRRYQDVPGRITGAIQPGAAIGAVAGPLLFGFVAEHLSFAIGWMISSAFAACAAAAVVLSARRLDPPADVTAAAPQGAHRLRS